MADDYSPLESEIRRLIEVAGPLPVAEFMRLCLTHPQHGYYVTRGSIGAKGDFITAPEISQMFGELIGLWMVGAWRQMGMPENVRIVELGPGRATMMIDALRAAKIVKDFHAAAVLHLVEISPKLRVLQELRLEGVGVPVHWHATLTDVPEGPAIIVANEFVDALPVHQAVKQADGWHERVVVIKPDGRLAMSTAPDTLPHFDATLPQELRRHSPDGSIYEWRPDTIAFDIGKRVRSDGVALIIDYGHIRQGLGETLQAVSGHNFSDPLLAPGKSDVTAHVDFVALARNAEIMGGRTYGPISQRDFLFRLGIDRRATALKENASPEQALAIDSALSRLTATGPKGMGELFKALAIADPKIQALPGFEGVRS